MVVDSLFIIAPDVCGVFVFGPCLCNAVLNQGLRQDLFFFRHHFRQSDFFCAIFSN